MAALALCQLACWSMSAAAIPRKVASGPYKLPILMGTSCSALVLTGRSWHLTGFGYQINMGKLWRFGATMAVAATLLASCGAPPSRADLVGERTSQSQATTTTTAPPSVPAGLLQAALFRTSDVQRGWVVDTTWTAKLTRPSACLAKVITASATAGATATATTAFRSFPGGPVSLVEYLASFPGSRASRVFDHAKASLDACTKVSGRVQGAVMSATVARTGPVDMGSQSTSFEGRLALGGYSLHGNMALVRQGDVLVVVLLTTAANPYPAALRTYTSDALAKLAKVGIS